jgi:hypothetical protein
MRAVVLKGKQQDNLDDLNAFTQLAQTWLSQQGFPYVEGEIKGQNAATKEVDLKAQGTELWDTQRQHEDGEFYWSSPSAQYPKWKQVLLEMTGYVVKSAEVEIEIEDKPDETLL